MNQPRCSHLFNDPFLQQALLFGSHHKVVGVIFIVDDVFQIDAWKKERNFTTAVIHTEKQAKSRAEKQNSHHYKKFSALDDLDTVELNIN